MGAATSTRERGTVRRVPPGPRGHLLWGSMFEFQRDPLGFIREVAGSYGGVVRYRMGNMVWYQANHPDGVRRVLQENNRNYGKGTLTLGILKPVLGEGLLTSEGELWRRQRRLMQPVFHRRSVAAFGEIMSRETLAMLGRWRPGEQLDVAAEMSRLTLDVVTGALFHSHAGDEPEVIGRAVGKLVEEIGYRFKVPVYPPRYVPTPRNHRMNAAQQTIDRAVYRIIEERRSGTDAEDLLSLLMHARDEATGETMSDRQLRDEAITLYLAGHETTANALAWSFYLLARNPEAGERLRAELEPLGDAPPNAADLPRLPYLRMVVEEAMRLYPPVWITNRQALAEDEICGYHVPPGQIVMVSPYVLHRHPDYWERPEEFDPERFAPGRSEGRPRFAYFPFGGGPRQCIGRDMALVEAQLVLATVAQRYRLRLASDRPIEPDPTVTLRPKGGLPMIAEPVR
jgi:cytochrome P450